MKENEEKISFDTILGHINKYIPLIMTAGALILATAVFGLFLSSNDDALIRAIAEGSYTGKPDAHLIYVMYPLGLILKLMYTIVPKAPWYDLMTVFLHLLCWYLIIWRTMSLVKRNGRKLYAAVITVVLLLGMDFKFVSLHQYTVLAAVLAATAIYLIVTMPNEKPAKNWGLVVFLLTMSLWLRKEAFLMALPIVLLAMLTLAIRVVYDNRKLILISAAVLLTISACSFILDASAYTSEEWKYFKKYNEIRTELYDYFKFPEYDKYQSTYEEANISLADYEILAHNLDVSFCEDLTIEDYEILAAKYDSIMEEWKQFYSVPKKLIKDTFLAVFFNTIQPVGWAMFIVCAVSYLLFMKEKSRFALMPVLAYGYRIAFTAFFTYKGRFPERVAYGLLFIIFMYMAGTLFMFACDRTQEPDKKPAFNFDSFQLITVCMIAAIAVNIACFLPMAYFDAKNVKLLSDRTQASYEYCIEHPDNIYLVNTYSVANAAEYMFAKNRLPENFIVMGNWTSRSPLEKMRLENAGITNFSDDLLQENVYMMQAWDLDYSWIHAHYKDRGINVGAGLIDRIPCEYNTKLETVSVKMK